MAVTNPYYEFTPAFVPGTKARAEDVNVQYQNIQNAFDLLPGDADALTTDTAIFAPESGAGNAYVVTMPDTRTSNQDGDGVRFFATHTNTGAATLDVDGIGPVAFTNWDGDAFVGGEVISGRLYEVRYDATNTRFILAATLDAALQVEWAEEWAQNPEDVPVSIAAGGDGATTFSALHWAAKSLASAASGRINTDIVTATPPTTELVTGNLEIWDLDDTDLLARFGFTASSNLTILNYMHGGDVRLQAENVGGSVADLFRGDPDGSANVYYAGAQRLITANDGLQLRAAANDTSQRTLVYAYTTGTARARIGHRGAGTFDIVNEIHGENVTIAAEDLVGTEQLLLTLDPDALAVSTPAGVQLLLPLENDAVTPTLAFGDGDTGIYEEIDDELHFATLGVSRFEINGNIFRGSGTNAPSIENSTASTTNPTLMPRNTDGNTGIGWRSEDILTLISGGEPRFEALATGVTRVISPGTLGTDPANLQFVTSSVGSKGHVGFFSSGDLELRNSQVSNSVVIQGTDALSTLNSMARFDPDGQVDLWYDGLTVFRTTVQGVDIADTADNDPVLAFYSDAFGSRQAFIQSRDTASLIIRNEVHGEGITIDAEDLAGTPQTILSADPDAETTLRADTNIRLEVAAGELAFSGTANGQSAMYFNNLDRLVANAVGEAQVRRDTDVDTDQCRLGFAHNNGTSRGWVGFGIQGNSRIELNSEVHGGSLYLTGETSGGAAQNLFSGTPGTNDTVVYRNGISELVIGQDKITVNSLFLNERSAAVGDVAGDGQIWCETDSPNRLRFTDDSGQDWHVAMAGGFTSDNVFVNTSRNFNTSGNFAANNILYYDNGSNYTVTLQDNSATNRFEIYQSITILAPTSGNITIAEGASTTLYDESGTDTVGGVVLSGGAVTIFRASSTDYIIWGNGYT